MVISCRKTHLCYLIFKNIFPGGACPTPLPFPHRWFPHPRFLKSWIRPWLCSRWLPSCLCARIQNQQQKYQQNLCLLKLDETWPTFTASLLNGPICTELLQLNCLLKIQPFSKAHCRKTSFLVLRRTRLTNYSIGYSYTKYVQTGVIGKHWR